MTSMDAAQAVAVTEEGLAQPAATLFRVAARAPRRTVRSRRFVLSAQALIVVAWLAAWQWLPAIPALSRHVNILNKSYISSPAQIAKQIGTLVHGTAGETFWPSLGTTMEGTLVGLAIAVLIGTALGLVLSESEFAAKVLKPFVTAFNATPLVALIPIIVVIFGVTVESSMISAALLSVLVIFFNSLEGGRSVPAEIMANAGVLGAGRLDRMLRIRFPYVLAWMFTAMPVAISFALVGAVTTEFLVGVNGMGKMLTVALSFSDANLTIALAVLLATVGVALVGLVSLLRARVLHWWEQK
jgi:NitT/TauT family transport system permease protein